MYSRMFSSIPGLLYSLGLSGTHKVVTTGKYFQILLHVWPWQGAGGGWGGCAKIPPVKNQCSTH